MGLRHVFPVQTNKMRLSVRLLIEDTKRNGSPDGKSTRALNQSGDSGEVWASGFF